MLKIGEFSQLGRVSVRMLRHYDATGLLKPAEVDHLSGYRFYAVEQLPRLNRILALKDLGLSLEQVGRLLAVEEPPASELRGMLAMRRADLEEELREYHAAQPEYAMWDEKFPAMTAFYADTSKYEKTFGPFDPTPHDEAIGHTTTWFREREGL